MEIINCHMETVLEVVVKLIDFNACLILKGFRCILGQGPGGIQNLAGIAI